MLQTIPISEIKKLTDRGYTLFQGGDAAKVNSDHFMIFVNHDRSHTIILCPTFLRGPVLIDLIGKINEDSD